MKKIFLLTLVSLSALFLCQSCQNNSKKLYTVGIVQLIDAPILDTARAGVIQGLASKGYIDGKNIKIDFQNAQGDMSNVPLMLKKFTTDKVDLIITITTPCMVAAAQIIKGIPVVYTVAFSPEQMKVKSVPKTMTGISDPMDMTEFLNFIKKIKPNIKKIGMPVNPAEVNSIFALNKLEAVCAKNNVELLKININSTNDIKQAAETLVAKGIEAFAVSADNTVNAGIVTLTKVAEKFKVPIFATAINLVKSGAAAGIGSDYKKWGEECGIVAASIIGGKKAEDIPQKDLASFLIEVNTQACKAQGVVIPDDIMKLAHVDSK